MGSLSEGMQGSAVIVGGDGPLDYRGEKVLPADIASGAAPACLLPFIPLMQGRADPAIIQQWLQLASAEPDARRRGDYGGLALCSPWRRTAGPHGNKRFRGGV